MSRFDVLSSLDWHLIQPPIVDGVGTNKYTYNPVNAQLGAGRLLSVDGPLTNDTISYTYDELGRVKSRAINNVEQRLTYDALGRITVLTNVLGTFSNNYVNATFRLSSVVYPNGQKTLFNYFGNTNDQRLEEIKHITAASNIISKFNYTYDAEGQIATWTQQTNSGTPKVFELGYDSVNQLLSAVLHRGN